jgi:hypothetical protein
MGDGRTERRTRSVLVVVSAVLAALSTQVTWFEYGWYTGEVQGWDAGLLIALAVFAAVAAVVALVRHSAAADRSATVAVALLAGVLLSTIVSYAQGADTPGGGMWLGGAALAFAGAAILLPLAKGRGTLARIALVVVLPVAITVALVVAPPGLKHPEITVIR